MKSYHEHVQVIFHLQIKREKKINYIVHKENEVYFWPNNSFACDIFIRIEHVSLKKMFYFLIILSFVVQSIIYGFNVKRNTV